MTTLAIVNPTDLTAEELKSLLEQRPELWSEIRLLTQDPDIAGTLADIAGAAALVSAIDETSFDSVDVVFFCGEETKYKRLRDELPASVTAIAVGGLEHPDHGQPLVAGLNLEHLDPRQLLISPHPATIGLCQILSPLLPLGLKSAAATAILPASVFGQEALDELFAQTRDLLSFKTSSSFTHLPGPLAFNLLDAEPGAIAREVAMVLGEGAPLISASALYGGIFHGLGLSVHLSFEGKSGDLPGLDTVTDLLEESSVIDFAADPHLVGPKDIAGNDGILIADLRESAPGHFTLWAVLDHLRIGGALNALAILEALGTPVTH